MDTLLPDTSAQKSAHADDYLKLNIGETRFRVLSDIINGYEYWVDANGNVLDKTTFPFPKGSKPVKIHIADKMLVEVYENSKYFIACVVYNVTEQKIQILVLTKWTIIKALDALMHDADWKDFTKFDIVITRTGEKQQTNYAVTPKPAKPLEDRVLASYKTSTIDLNLLYEGKHPIEKIGEFRNMSKAEEYDAMVGDDEEVDINTLPF